MQGITSCIHLLATFQNIFQLSEDWIKPPRLIVPAMCLKGIVALFLHYHSALKPRRKQTTMALQDRNGWITINGDKGSPRNGHPAQIYPNSI